MSKIKVLFIEDDKDQLMIYRNKFKLEDIELVGAQEKTEALNLAREEKPDLILLDLLLGNEDGFDVLKELKQGDDTKDIPVIVFTNFDTEEARNKSEDLGAEEYLLKARTTPGQMAEKIKALIG